MCRFDRCGLDGVVVVVLFVLFDDRLAGEKVDSRLVIVKTVGVGGICGIITVTLPVPEDQTILPHVELVPPTARWRNVSGHHDARTNGVDDDELAPVTLLDLSDHGDGLGQGGARSVDDELPLEPLAKGPQLELLGPEVVVFHLHDSLLTVCVADGVLKAISRVSQLIHHGRPADEEIEIELHRVGSAVRRTLTQDLVHHLLLEPELINELRREVPESKVARLLDGTATEVTFTNDLVLSVVQDHRHDLPTRKRKPTRLHLDSCRKCRFRFDSAGVNPQLANDKRYQKMALLSIYQSKNRLKSLFLTLCPFIQSVGGRW